MKQKTATKKSDTIAYQLYIEEKTDMAAHDFVKSLLLGIARIRGL